MEKIDEIALKVENLIFDTNYKVQDLNLALLTLATEIEDLNEKDFLRNEIIEMISQLLKFQTYIEKQRLSILKVYNLFEVKKALTMKQLKEAKKLDKPTKALSNE